VSVAPVGYTGAGGDNGVDHHKHWLRFPYGSTCCDPIISTRARIYNIPRYLHDACNGVGLRRIDVGRRSGVQGLPPPCQENSANKIASDLALLETPYVDLLLIHFPPLLVRPVHHSSLLPAHCAAAAEAPPHARMLGGLIYFLISTEAEMDRNVG
jgi:hypothetical protein